MSILLVLILIVAAVAVFFSLKFKGWDQKKAFISMVTNYKSVILDFFSKKTGISNLNKNAVKMDLLNCRIKPSQYNDGSSMCDAFAVEICGTINTPDNRHKAALRVEILDITDGLQRIQSVQAKVKQWQNGNSRDLYCIFDLGSLPNKTTVMSDWTNVAKIRLDWILLPRIGKRKLKFNISVLSADNGRELASSQCMYEHENPYFGYIDLQENQKRSKTLTVALTFSVIAADGNLNDDEVEFIKRWARENINTSQTPDSDCSRLEKAMDETVAFFKDGNLLNTYDICMEIAEITPLAQKYDILEVCLNAIKLKGAPVSKEIGLLRDIVSWLEVDGEKFRAIVERIIPLDMLDTTDLEIILGVTSDMTGEKARAHLNKEYAKWNSRVTNSDPQIQSQADQMLKLIAEARTQLVKQ